MFTLREHPKFLNMPARANVPVVLADNQTNWLWSKRMEQTAVQILLDEARFLRYRRRVVQEMKPGEDRYALLRSIDKRLGRLEREIRRAA